MRAVAVRHRAWSSEPQASEFPALSYWDRVPTKNRKCIGRVWNAFQSDFLKYAWPSAKYTQPISPRYSSQFEPRRMESLSRPCVRR
jgi:hypothetical protein